jgi:sphingolipid 4-desaturase/C4-monooxygenase
VPAAFLRSDGPEPHRDRTRAILQQHPEIRGLAGRNPWTALYIVALVAAHLGLAALVREAPWWAVLALAYGAGAVVQHALYVLMHETNHNLVFTRRSWNTLAGILANVANVVPSSLSFQRYHLKHHAHQGFYPFDGDLPSRWEARLVGHRAVGKALWLLFFPVFLALRPAHLRGMAHLCPWTVLNIAVVVAVDVAVLELLGPAALLYLALSTAFSLGLHPVGARWISEHYVFAPPQETYSYYGPLNRVAFNIGYHNEHHDFPAVPWNRVPEIRRLAPEWYEPLVAHRSWTRLLLRFIGDPGISLFSRVSRPGPRAPPVESPS